jgi:hypothetical protein
MNDNILAQKFDVCFLHLKRMQQGLEHVKHFRPLTHATLENMVDEDLAFLELFTSRFAKLQDYMGENLFPAVLEFMGTDPNKLSMIDKLNKMEKYGLLESVEQWKSLRDIRNKWTHEYPDSYEIIAKCLNDMMDKCGLLEKNLRLIVDECSLRA